MKISLEDGLDYARKVMQKFNKETNTFKEFLMLMRLFRGKFIDRETLSSEVHGLFKGQDDLIQGFHRFFPDNHDCTCSQTLLSDGVEVLGAGRNSKRKAGEESSFGKRMSQEDKETERKQQFDRGSPSEPEQDEDNRKEESVEFFNKVRKMLNNDVKYREFLETLCTYQDHKDIHRLDKEALEIFKQIPELEIEFSRQTADKLEGCKIKRREPCLYRDRKTNVNPYEKILSVCEDEIFAADMTFHHLESTKESTLRYLENQKEVGSKKYGAEQFFEELHMRVIKQLYSSCDPWYAQVMENQLLGDQPILAAELVLKRLDQKLEELKAWREYRKESWAEKFEINSEKALNFNKERKITREDKIEDDAKKSKSTEDY